MLRLLALLPLTDAWWDNGHLLTAEVARQQLTKEEVDVINGILQESSYCVFFH